jgi:hypothetical protein
MTRRQTLLAFIILYTAFVVMNAATQHIDTPDVRLLSPVFVASVLWLGSTMKKTSSRRMNDERSHGKP